MTADSAGEITVLLEAVRRGEPTATSRLVDLVYPHLHHLAQGMLRRERDPGLQTTAILHDAIVRLLESDLMEEATDGRYLLGSVARIMRCVLVEHARRRGAEKRGGRLERQPFDVLLDYFERKRIDVVALRDALDTLQARHERPGLVMTLRTYGGYTVAEIAERVGVSESAVEKDLRFARAWLRNTLEAGDHVR